MCDNVQSIFPPGYWYSLLVAQIYHAVSSHEFLSIWSLKTVELLKQDEFEAVCGNEKLLRMARRTLHKFGIDENSAVCQSFLRGYWMIAHSSLFNDRWKHVIELGTEFISRMETNPSGMAKLWTRYITEFMRVTIIEELISPTETPFDSVTRNMVKILLSHPTTKTQRRVMKNIMLALVTSDGIEKRSIIDREYGQLPFLTRETAHSYISMVI